MMYSPSGMTAVDHQAGALTGPGPSVNCAYDDTIESSMPVSVAIGVSIMTITEIPARAPPSVICLSRRAEDSRNPAGYPATTTTWWASGATPGCAL
jgi:hypothetical protein